MGSMGFLPNRAVNRSQKKDIASQITPPTFNLGWEFKRASCNEEGASGHPPMSCKKFRTCWSLTVNSAISQQTERGSVCSGRKDLESLKTPRHRAISAFTSVLADTPRSKHFSARCRLTKSSQWLISWTSHRRDAHSVWSDESVLEVMTLSAHSSFKPSDQGTALYSESRKLPLT